MSLSWENRRLWGYDDEEDDDKDDDDDIDDNTNNNHIDSSALSCKANILFLHSIDKNLTAS